MTVRHILRMTACADAGLRPECLTCKTEWGPFFNFLNLNFESIFAENGLLSFLGIYPVVI